MANIENPEPVFNNNPIIFQINQLYDVFILVAKQVIFVFI